jgi:glycosyltransferase involved in cell wall biosynthesis
LPRIEKGERRRPIRVVLYEPSGLGGFCQYTFQLAEALTRQGCEITLVTADAYELKHLPRSFRVVFLFRRSRAKQLLNDLFRRPGPSSSDWISRAGETQNRKRVSSLRAIRIRILQLRLVFQLLRRRPDVVHFQSTGRGRDLPFIRLLKRLRFRVVCTAHDLLPHDSTSTSERRAHTEVYRLVDRVIVHAEHNRREMTEVFEVPPERISVIPHGSYDLLFPRGRVSKAQARAEIGWPANARIILFFGLIKRYKGLEFLLQAFDQVERRVPDAFLAIVGHIFRRDREGHAYYSRLVEEASRRPNVYCVPRYVPVGEVGTYLASADLVVLPYTKTYQSGVLMSAYAAGRPVVVTEKGGLPEMVREEKTGLVVPPRDPDALARAIEELLERPGLADQMGENASRLADSVYSWDAIAKRTVELYRAVIAARDAAPTAQETCPAESR